MCITKHIITGILFMMVAACAHVKSGDPNVPIVNFRTVEPGFYRGGQPDAQGFQYLKSIGVKTVINMNDNVSDIRQEKINTGAEGLQWLNVPLSGIFPPHDSDVKTIQDALADPANRPVYLHCLHGEDRTGLMVGVYRVRVDKWTPKKAHDEMMSNGFHPVLVGLEEYFWIKAK